MNEVAKVLHDGLDRLRERGLTKYQLCDVKTGQVCARGAVSDATPEHRFGQLNWTPTLLDADELLSLVAGEQYPDRAFHGWSTSRADVATFNNHDDTTQEDVERVFEKAIVRAYEMEASA